MFSYTKIFRVNSAALKKIANVFYNIIIKDSYTHVDFISPVLFIEKI